MTTANPAGDDPTPAQGTSSELRRLVGQATERIHEIIDAAERVALQIRSDAETEAQTYLAERMLEADRLATERTATLDVLTRRLADNAEQFRNEAERMLAELDQVVEEARADVYRNGSIAAVESETRLEPVPAPKPAEPELRSVEPELPPEPEVAPAPQKVSVAAYPGTGAADEAEPDRTAEALLRATQMAVTGQDRSEIVAVLESDFPGVDAGAIADEILG